MNEFLIKHRYLWRQIKADIDATANDKSYAWMSWMLASAICCASGCPHIEHIERVWVRGDVYGDGRERPPF